MVNREIIIALIRKLAIFYWPIFSYYILKLYLFLILEYSMFVEE